MSLNTPIRSDMGRNRRREREPSAASMPLTTVCPQCRTVLNLPDGAAGKKLKCPQCGTKFLAGDAGAAPRSTAPGAYNARPASSLLPTTPSPIGPSSHGDADLPVSGAGDLRETFNPDLLFGEAGKPAARAVKPKDAADPIGLFDDAPVGPRPRTIGDAKRQARRCPDCGSVVPQGMSLCGRCGLDLDTGRRTTDVMDEVLEDTVPGGPAVSGPPISIVLVGALTLITSALLAILAVVKMPDIGGLAFALVGLFGVFASVQFLRGKAVRPLVSALLIGGAIALIWMVILPVVNQKPAVQQALDPDEIQIQAVEDSIDWKLVTWGLVVVGIDVGLVILLNTPPIHRHFERQRSRPGFPGGLVP